MFVLFFASFNCCIVFNIKEKHVPFSLGDAIYGRVMVDPVQNLGDSFICSIEKVFLCTGTDGYVPKYNPSNYEFGCLADAQSLLYRFKIIVSSTSDDLSLFLHFVVASKTSVCPSHCRTRPSQRPRPGHLAT